ncbi:MAG: hypothetical protein A3G88_05865, partial [Omnitrophica WOR_2 bacterium RIFCSPLOWO2_12_FULL_63_16]
AARRRGWLLALWRELRPKQWVKNLFVFAPIFFSAKAFSLQVVTQTLLAFGCFCAVSSSVYLLNDLVDRAQDRLHPEKRHRPLAAGLLNVWIARIAAAGLLIPALSGGMALSRSFAMVLAAYWALNVLYAWRLKQAVILDVFVVAAGYLLRVMAGAVVIQAVMSRWLLICTTLLALFIALCKRRHELVLLAEGAPNHRHVLTDYPIPFLDAMIGIITASALVSYTLYTVSEEIVAKFGSQGLLVTAPFVLYGFFRYLYLVYHKAEGGDPTQSILTDRPMMVNLGLWAATAGVILYGKG